MTYYEWINYLESLKDAPLPTEAVDKINNSELTYEGNIKIRFLNHVVDLINYRLNNNLDKFLLKSKTVGQDKNSLNIEINDLKKEIALAKSLASIKLFDENTREQLINNIKTFGEEMNTSVKDSYSNCQDSEILFLINNLDFNN